MTNSANAASVALISGLDVLLIKRALPPLAGYWTLPGGRREPGETITDCARREIFEELGLKLTTLAPVTSQTSEQFTIAIFASHAPDTVLTPSDEIADWQWRRLDDLADLKTTPQLAEILQLAFAALTAPEK